MPVIKRNDTKNLSPVITLEMMRGSTDICRTLISSSPGNIKYLFSLAVMLVFRRAKPRPIPKENVTGVGSNHFNCFLISTFLFDDLK